MQENLQVEKIREDELLEVNPQEIHVVSVHEFLYAKFTKLKYPEGFVCIDEEKNIYERIKKYEQLTSDEKEIFVLLGDFALEYFNKQEIDTS